LLTEVISKGLADDNYHWLKSKALLAYFAERASEHLNLNQAEQDGKRKVSWRPFEILFHTDGLSGARNTYVNKTGILPKDHETVDSLFD
jgi:hypothetical protein